MTYKMSTRRKLAISSWDSPREGNIYGKLTLDVEAVDEFIKWVREETGEKVTITHFVGWAVGEALKKAPAINGRIFMGKYIPHDQVSLSFLVALEGGSDLAQVKIPDIDQKKVSDVAQFLRARAEKLRAGKDDDFNKSKGPLQLLPTWILKPMLSIIGWLGGAAGLNIPALGVKAYPFGAAVVTSVGMLGVDEGFVPPTPFARVPLYVLIGSIQENAVVRDGNICVRRQVVLTATLDHRFMDGSQGGVLASTFRTLFANPWLSQGMTGPPESSA